MNSLEEILKKEIKTEIEEEEPCSSTTGLLDVPIKTEQDEFSDALPKMEEDFGESNDIQQDAVKLFNKAMSYGVTPETQKKPKKTYTNWKSLAKTYPKSFLNSGHFDSTAKDFRKSDLKAGFYPRSKFDVDCTEFFQKGQKSGTQFEILHEKLEKERNELYNEQLNKDVDRLLLAANKVYGPSKQWLVGERAELLEYCKKFRAGSLNEQDKVALRKFYERVFNLKPAEEETDNFESPVKKSPLKRKSNHKEEEVKWYEQTKTGEEEYVNEEPEIIEIDDEMSTEEGEDEDEEPSSLPPLNSFSPFHPGEKYEMQKQFRNSAIKIFMELFSVDARICGRGETNASQKNDLEHLIDRFNAVMECEDKIWSLEEIEELGLFYERFRNKLNFTIIQTKELSFFLRKIYGQLEDYEIAREKDSQLAEKRRYWQEYGKMREPKKKKPSQPYNSLDGDRKRQKLALSKAWRIRRAGEEEDATFEDPIARTRPNTNNKRI
uniref:Uncharacterized protein n=1 Tax=Caenorhabditis japonica TaxID=281687 RepID=A0A8R1HTD7_CAEJA